VLLIGCGCGRKHKEFKSEAGGFSVMVPVVLTEAISQVEDEQKVDMHQLRGQRGKTTYYVTYADHPEILRSESKGMLDYFCNGTVAAMKGGRLVMQTSISLDGNPGRELVIEVKGPDGQDATIKARIFKVKTRLYTAMVLAAEGRKRLGMDDFLRSLKLSWQMIHLLDCSVLTPQPNVPGGGSEPT
jgi:hypothetical protein